jgi:hypothetical protein
MADLTALWHYHHADYLVEFPDETEASRREFIEAHKDRGERALRLRLLKPVKGELPSALRVARAKWQAADAEYQATRAKYKAAHAKWRAAYAEWEAAGAKYQTAGAKCQAAIAKYRAAQAKYQATRAEYKAAHAKWRAAYAEWEAADAKYQAAWAEWEDAYRDNLAAIEALHKIECPDCPWNGETIFTRKDANGAWY